MYIYINIYECEYVYAYVNDFVYIHVYTEQTDSSVDVVNDITNSKRDS